MRKIVFEWDPKKAKSNIRKHNISFEEASSAFFDEQAIIFDDPDHSEKEERLILLGTSSLAKILIVCFCAKDDDIIRIISARKATKIEEQQYIDINLGW